MTVHQNSSSGEAICSMRFQETTLLVTKSVVTPRHTAFKGFGTFYKSVLLIELAFVKEMNDDRVCKGQ